MEKSFLAFVEQSIKKNWDFDALTDYKGATLQYKDLARKIEKLHILLEESGVRPGDKVAICGRNSSHWGVAFLATLTYGAIAVPILHEFKADTIHNIVNHSDARLLFVGDMAWESLNEAEMPQLEGIILMTDFTLLVCRSKQLEYAREHLNEMFGHKFPRNFRREHVSYRRDDPEELAIINYTSGTTSFSKGVMLPYRSLWSNTQFAFEVLPLQPGNHSIRFRSAPAPTGQPGRIHASHGTHVRACLRVFVRNLLRMPCLFPHPYAKSEDYRSGIYRCEAPYCHRRSTDYRKDYQEKRASENGDIQDEDANEAPHYQRQDKRSRTRAFGERIRRTIL